MSRGIELTLAGSFSKFVKIFVEAFPRAHRRFADVARADFEQNVNIYAYVIGENCDTIFRAAAQDLNQYLNRYSIHANQSADEFKIICHLGKAIERRLRANGLDVLAQIHMATMIGLLDFRLTTKGIIKPRLTQAMSKLIKGNHFDEELGQNGCYLTYKCVSTTPGDLATSKAA